MEMKPITNSALENFPDQFERYFYEIPESSWQWNPESWEGVPSESFNAIEQICHVRDIEIEGYHVRFNRLLNEENPTLDSLDGYALVETKNYALANPTLVFNEIRVAREKTLKLLGNLTEVQLGREGFFEGYGRVTVAGLVHFLSSHDQQHLSGLQWLSGKIESNA